MKFLSPEVALYFSKSAMRLCMKYCCRVWADAPNCYLELLDKLQKQICRTLVLHLLPLLNPWLIVEMQPAQVFSVSITLVDVHLSSFYRFHFLFLEGGLLVILIDCMVFLSSFLDVTKMTMLTVSFLVQLSHDL